VGIFVLRRQQQEDERNGSMRSFIVLTKYQQDDQFKKDEMNRALSMREIFYQKI
jgi:hypothetical protein